MASRTYGLSILKYRIDRVKHKLFSRFENTDIVRKSFIRQSYAVLKKKLYTRFPYI